MNRRDSCGTAALVMASDPGTWLGVRPPTTVPLRLVDVTTAAGIQFQHNNGAYGGKLLPETLGAGCAFIDYDSDGWQDILLVNGMDWPGHKRSARP